MFKFRSNEVRYSLLNSVLINFLPDQIVFIDRSGGILVSHGGHFNNGTFLSLKMVLEDLGFSVTCPNGPLR